MKQTRVWGWGVIVFLFFSMAAAYGAFPPVPFDLEPLRVANAPAHGQEGFLYVWSDAHTIYIRIEPRIDAYWIAGDEFRVIQQAKQYQGKELHDDTGAVPDSLVTAPSTFSLEFEDDTGLDPAQPFSVLYSGFQLYTLNVTPDLTSWIYPSNGIWKNGDGSLSLYIQKYQTRSCVLVVTWGDGTYTAFLDTDYADGINVSDDVDRHGYSVQLSLTDATHGNLSAVLEKGPVAAEIFLKFPEAP